MHPYLRILRPFNALVSSGAVLAGILLSTEPPLSPTTALRGALAALVAFFFSSAGNVRNDIFDSSIDTGAHPDRPLPKGEMTLKEAHLESLLLYGVSFVGSALLGVAPFFFVLVSFLLLELYERRLKAWGLAGNASIALLSGAPFLLGGIVVGRVPPILFLVFLLAFLSTLGREILKDVEDSPYDGGRRTLPQRIGEESARRWGGVFLFATVALSPLPWILYGGAWGGEMVLGWGYLGLVALADVAFLYAALGSPSAGSSQRIVKVGMGLALLGVLLGRVQVGWI